MLVGKIPDPLGSITDDDFLLRATPAAVPGFQIDAFTEFLGGLYSARVRGRVGIADSIALFVPGGLSENAAQLDFTRMRRFAVCPAFTPFDLFLDHRHPRSVHLYIQDGSRLAYDDRQIQLNGALDLALLAPGDIGANRLCRALNRFGRDVEAG